jgi:hypothetical protein
MRLYASAELSVPNAQTGETRGGIAAHKYEGITIFQRTSPRSRRDCGDATACGIIDVRSEIWRSGMSQKKRGKGTISARRSGSPVARRDQKQISTLSPIESTKGE